MRTNNKRGISLIVLIITIIVMIILAAAIILSISNSGIMDKANKAKTESDIANLKEYVNVLEAEWELGVAETSGKTKKEYINTKLAEKGYKTDGTNGSYEISDNGAINTLYVENGSKVVIPEGFSYVEGTISTGVVIKDSDGNEFVWVPVEDFSKFERTSTYDGTITTPEDYDASDVGYAEPAISVYDGVNNDVLVILSLTNDLTGEWKEYTEMRASVNKNKGFYIGRYEAGTSTKRTGEADGTTDLVVQKNKYVYNYVPWGKSQIDVTGDIITDGKNQGKGAVELSRNMYKSSQAVVSTLCYGVQWDAVVQFIYRTEAEFFSNPKGRVCFDETFKLVTDTYGLVLTGSAEEYKACNIYDLVGNVSEITMEGDRQYSRVYRGYSYSTGGLSQASLTFRSQVGGGPEDSYDFIGFRVALYIK